jgi:YD repeat-containing protein
MVDPLGQRLQFTYDAQLRLVAVTDAVGQVTTLGYDHAPDPLKITSVTDPFGRTATLTYNAAGQLESITDVIGLPSRFAYGPTDFITSLTTPYGRTSFRQEATSASPRFIEATDAMGGTERLEFYLEQATLPAAEPVADVPTGFSGYNENLRYYNSVHWDKRAWALHPGDLAKGTLTHWLMTSPAVSGNGKSVPVPHSRKPALESRVWYAYPEQSNLRYTGTGTQPTRVGRVLEDGTSQIIETTYNTQGSPLVVTDPNDQIYTVRGADRIQALRLVLAAATQRLKDAAGDGSSFRWRYSGTGSHGLGPTLEELIAQGE